MILQEFWFIMVLCGDACLVMWLHNYMFIGHDYILVAGIFCLGCCTILECSCKLVPTYASLLKKFSRDLFPYSLSWICSSMHPLLVTKDCMKDSRGKAPQPETSSNEWCSRFMVWMTKLIILEPLTAPPKLTMSNLLMFPKPPLLGITLFYRNALSNPRNK